VLIMTTSCDAGVRVDLSCDSCDLLFFPAASVPLVPAAVWQAAIDHGWRGYEPTPLGRHFCPDCADARDRLVEVAPGAV
jgi:hypothetical protein